jgi:hypothetical protein
MSAFDPKRDIQLAAVNAECDSKGSTMGRVHYGIFYDLHEDGLRLAATASLATPAEAFSDARKIVDSRVEGPRR